MRTLQCTTQYTPRKSSMRRVCVCVQQAGKENKRTNVIFSASLCLVLSLIEKIIMLTPSGKPVVCVCAMQSNATHRNMRCHVHPARCVPFATCARPLEAHSKRESTTGGGGHCCCTPHKQSILCPLPLDTFAIGCCFDTWLQWFCQQTRGVVLAFFPLEYLLLPSWTRGTLCNNQFVRFVRSPDFLSLHHPGRIPRS